STIRLPRSTRFPSRCWPIAAPAPAAPIFTRWCASRRPDARPSENGAGGSIEPPHQEQRDHREGREDDRPHEIADHEGRPAAIGLEDRYVLRHRVDDEEVHSDRRRYQPYLDDD